VYTGEARRTIKAAFIKQMYFPVLFAIYVDLHFITPAEKQVPGLVLALELRFGCK
jgi:hypothetical protein